MKEEPSLKWKYLHVFKTKNKERFCNKTRKSHQKNVSSFQSPAVIMSCDREIKWYGQTMLIWTLRGAMGSVRIKRVVLFDSKNTFA